MPGTTSRGIIFPVNTDVMQPLAGWFAQQAASVNDALDEAYSEFEVPEIPYPLSSSLFGIKNITATAWADIPEMDEITLDLPRAAWVNIALATWVSAPSGEVRVSSRVTGATTLSESQLEVGGVNAFGQIVYTRNTTGTVQGSSLRTVRLNAGTNVITPRAYGALGGVKDVRYTCLQVTVTRWA